MRKSRNPVPTVDIIIEVLNKDGRQGILLIKRKNPPYGWALPGGFVDYGETLEEAAIWEAKEETSLDIQIKCQMHTYSDPDRDPRQHTISTVFIAQAEGKPIARDDAQEIGVFSREELNFPLAFDHKKILEDYFNRKSKERNISNEKEENMGGGAYHEPMDKLSNKTRELHRALNSLIEELEAVDWYQQRVNATENDELRDILAHNRDEEKEHAAMILEWIRRNDEAMAEELKTYLFTEGKITELEEEHG